MKAKVLITWAMTILILIFSLVETKARESGPEHFTQINETTLQQSAPSLFCDAVGDVPRAECEALVVLYEATDGPNWENNQGWLTDSYVCNWWGVTCGNDGLEELDLSYNQLSGQLPEDLGNLLYLKVIRLYENNLLGSIPTELVSLDSLEILGLSYNQLSGKIPPELGLNPNLLVVGLSYNQLSGSFPSTLLHASKLIGLTLNDNKFDGPLPEDIGTLENLMYLDIENNNFNGELPEEIGLLTDLIEFDISDNDFSGELPEEIGLLTDLIEIRIDSNNFGGSLPESVGSLTNLRVFEMQNNNFSGPLPEDIGGLKNLTRLSIGNNNFDGPLPESVGAMKGLLSIEAYNNDLVGPLPWSIMSLHQLRHINLSGTNLCVPPDENFVNWADTQIREFYGKSYCPYEISGEILDLEGKGIADVIVHSGDGIEAITDEDGVFSFSDLAAGSYILTPSKNRYVFSPGYHSVSSPPLTTSTFDFLGIKDPFYIYLPLIYPYPPDLFVEKIIVTQATQTEDNTVPLVQDRPTIARVFAKTSGNESVIGVPVTLHAKREGQTLGNLTEIPPSIPSNPERGDYGSTVNFTLPDDWLQGNVILDVIIDEQNIYSEGDETNNTHSVSLQFNPVPILDVKLIPINLTQLPDQTFFPAHTEDTVTSWLMHVFPVSDVEVSMRTPIDFEGNLRLRDEMSRLLSTLSDIKTLDGAQAQQVYYGIMPPEVESNKPGLGAVGFRVSMGSGFPGVRPIYGPIICAHEIGHNLGILHTGCDTISPEPEYPYLTGSIGEYGLDVIDGKLWSPQAPDFATDLMSYCGWPDWVSDYTYTKLYEDQIENGSIRQTSVDEGIFIRINLDNNGTREFLPTYWLRAPLTKEATDSMYAVELVDSRGGVLSTHSVTVFETVDGGQAFRSIRVVLPQPKGRVKVIRLRKNGQVVAEKRVVVSPQKQVDFQLQMEKDQSTLHWESDGRPTIVRYALDDGQSWVTLGIDVNATSMDIPSGLEISDPNRFEVIVGR